MVGVRKCPQALVSLGSGGRDDSRDFLGRSQPDISARAALLQSPLQSLAVAQLMVAGTAALAQPLAGTKLLFLQSLGAQTEEADLLIGEHYFC